ncbi:protein mraZ [Bifidobacterium actinocoloniiforme DSM 22766]|uniref:Transcriptional regulator MraZ n=1 Tax=Bifidobacterium actinocoloniiforme DSM 22766 TaxID=1437605 RepID=A0A086YZR3_9BIFI|nr:division/cell wall cluster transcriptional repressor MraZ [Bifidobacterium actinocoloniiforme]AKV55064.1 MraZ family transcriptional regulator [Bifidobacterium actinocoloniiforme DSM 22766]KFI39763.1 protein mraZ [Bifidobacterium actinocoloniiforme DSM 22766]
MVGQEYDRPVSPNPASERDPEPLQPLPLLLGTYTPKMDAKGRLALPAKFRNRLGAGLVMARGQERCVYLLPADEFRRIAVRIQRTSMGDRSAREYLRVFLSGAVDQEPDKQGRILVPPMLREYAHLDQSVVVIGVGTRAEIWDQESWQTYLASKEQGYSDIADDVLPAVDF